MMIAVIIAPMSRTIPIPTRSLIETSIRQISGEPANFREDASLPAHWASKSAPSGLDERKPIAI
jgi:hypothetical protein